MKRFLISGSSKFNNYYLFYRYVAYYMPRDCIIVTCGGSSGTDAMAREYSNRCKIPIEEYPVAHVDKDSVYARNQQILEYCHSAIIFDDGKPGTAQHLRDLLFSTNKSVVVIEIDPILDTIDNYYECLDPELNEYFHTFKRSECNMQNLADAVMTVMRSRNVLQRIIDLDDSKFVKSKSPDMGAGFAHWIKANAVPEIKQLLALDERKRVKTSLVSLEEMIKIWGNKVHPVLVYTTTGLPVLRDYVDIIPEGNKLWLEADDSMVIKSNVWQTREQIDNDELCPINSMYEAKDTSGTKIFYRNADFESSPFRSGYWYVEVSTLK